VWHRWPADWDKEMRILLLGHTGKMGRALYQVLSGSHDVVGLNSQDFSATDFPQMTRIVQNIIPDIVINTVAFQGIDRCELEPEQAFQVNTLFPRHLACLCEARSSTLVHFSTDAVFADKAEGYCTESDTPAPINLYGATKYAGDCLVSSNCQNHYVCRIPLVFGLNRGAGQFVERMLARLRAGTGAIHVAVDIVSSPSYSLDLAVAVQGLLQGRAPYGTYHLANEGVASLYDLMVAIAADLIPEAVVKRASWQDFPVVGRKNLQTPLRSNKIQSLRPWRDAVQAYCRELREGGW
jgi:dTDP-4-dehydrorhamnose reductase